MFDADRATQLVRFLLSREPTEAEQAAIAMPGFDCDTFLVQLLCSAEGADLYGDLPEFFIQHLRQELSRGAQTHKLAHDLGLAQDDLLRVQGKIDGLNTVLIELLRQEDRIGGVFDSLRAIQSDYNDLFSRIGQIEAQLVLAEGVEHGR